MEYGKWIKSSQSSTNGACVEVFAVHSGDIYVRDSKNRAAGVLAFTAEEWDAFVAGAKDGEFDL